MRRKPKTLEVGRAYRLHIFGVPTSRVVLVSEIKQSTKTTRLVRIEPLQGGGVRSWVNYSRLLQAAWTEEKTAVN